MNRLLWLALIAALTLTAAAQESPPAPLAELGWLEGTWEGEARWRDAEQAQRFVAVYSSPRGGEVLSTSKTLDAAGQVAAFEFERFHRDREGRVCLTPFPAGRRAATFVRVERGPSLAVFEQPANDWPRRLRYARTGDTLTIEASGAPDQPALTVTVRRRQP